MSDYNRYEVKLGSIHGDRYSEPVYVIYMDKLESYYLQENLATAISRISIDSSTTVTMTIRVKVSESKYEYRTVCISNVVYIDHNIDPVEIKDLDEEVID